jgi:hypothetical protein
LKGSTCGRINGSQDGFVGLQGRGDDIPAPNFVGAINKAASHKGLLERQKRDVTLLRFHGSLSCFVFGHDTGFCQHVPTHALQSSPGVPHSLERVAIHLWLLGWLASFWRFVFFKATASSVTLSLLLAGQG